MNSWIERNKQYTMISAEDNFSISFAGMKFDNEDLKKMQPLFEKAAKGIAAIEAGEIKNPDEGRKVTHFTDRIDYAKSALFAEVEAFVVKVFVIIDEVIIIIVFVIILVVILIENEVFDGIEILFNLVQLVGDGNGGVLHCCQLLGDIAK